MSANNAAASFASPVVTVTLSIIAGSTEDLSPHKGTGKAYWWLRGSRLDREPYIPLDPGSRHPNRGAPGSEPMAARVQLVSSGRYTLGCGDHTRLSFDAPVVPCVVVLDVRDGHVELRPVGAAPALSVVADPTPTPTVAELGDEGDEGDEATDPHHIFGLACVASITFPSGQAAFERFGDLGRDRAYTYADVQGGLVGVRRGPAPRKVAPPTPVAPPAPPAPEPDPMSRVRALLQQGKASGPTLTEAAQAHHEAMWSASDLDDNAPDLDGDYTPTLPPPPVRQAEPVKPAPRSGGFTWNVGEYQVSDVAVERIQRDERWLSDMGMALPPPVVQLGGAMNSVGRGNLRRSHADWDATPLTLDNLTSIGAAVRSEGRRDVTVPRSALVMDEAGCLAGVRTEANGLRSATSLFSDTLPAMAQGLAAMKPALRSTVWNEQAPKSRQWLSEECVMRTRQREGDAAPSLYAVVSTKYTPMDADKISEVVARTLPTLPGGDLARGEATYDPDALTTRIDAIWHSNNEVNMSAGDVFKVGVRVSSHDGGGGAGKVTFIAWRNLCYNLIVIGTGKLVTARVVHTGDIASMVRDMREGILAVREAAAPFLERWGYLRTRTMSSLLVNPSAHPENNVLAIMRGITKSPRTKDMADLPRLRAAELPEGVTWSGIERDTLVEELLSAWRHEPGDSTADIVNAVTRLHSMARVPVPVVRQAEENAGLLTLAWGQA